MLKLILSPVDAEKELRIHFKQNKSLWEAFIMMRVSSGTPFRRTAEEPELKIDTIQRIHLSGKPRDISLFSMRSG